MSELNPRMNLSATMPRMFDIVCSLISLSVLVSKFQGASIVDQCVSITRWGSYIDESDPGNNPYNPEGNTSSMVCNLLLGLDWLKVNYSTSLHNKFSCDFEMSVVLLRI